MPTSTGMNRDAAPVYVAEFDFLPAFVARRHIAPHQFIRLFRHRSPAIRWTLLSRLPSFFRLSFRCKDTEHYLSVVPDSIE